MNELGEPGPLAHSSRAGSPLGLSIKWPSDSSASRAIAKSPGSRAPVAIQTARMAESLGLGIFVIEHSPGTGDGPFSVLGAVSQATSSISLGCVLPLRGTGGPSTVRHPSVIAKQASALSLISQRDVLVAFAAREPSWGKVALDCASIVGILCEPSGAPARYRGEVFSIDNAPNLPRPETKVRVAVRDAIDTLSYSHHVALQVDLEAGLNASFLKKYVARWENNDRISKPDGMVIMLGFPGGAPHPESGRDSLRISLDSLVTVLPQVGRIISGQEVRVVISVPADTNPGLLEGLLEDASAYFGQ